MDSIDLCFETYDRVVSGDPSRIIICTVIKLLKTTVHVESRSLFCSTRNTSATPASPECVAMRICSIYLRGSMTISVAFEVDFNRIVMRTLTWVVQPLSSILVHDPRTKCSLPADCTIIPLSWSHLLPTSRKNLPSSTLRISSPCLQPDPASTCTLVSRLRVATKARGTCTRLMYGNVLNRCRTRQERVAIDRICVPECQIWRCLLALNAREAVIKVSLDPCRKSDSAPLLRLSRQLWPVDTE